MPSVWTHTLFCEELSNSMEDMMTFYQEEMYLNIGAQGPDPFFYHKFWQWKKTDEINKLGTALHLSVCSEFLLDLIISATDYRNHVKAFVFGFVSHHILDKIVNPYISSKADIERLPLQEMESIIDTLMMKKLRHLETWKAPIYKEINFSSKLDEEIINLLHEKILLHFPEWKSETSTSYIKESYRDMGQAQRLFYDPYGWKHYVFPKFISSFSYKPVNDLVDYLNINNGLWYDSCTKQASMKSFLDLYEEARAKGLEVAGEIITYWKNPSSATLSKLRLLLNNLSNPDKQIKHEEKELAKQL